MQSPKNLKKKEMDGLQAKLDKLESDDPPPARSKKNRGAPDSKKKGKSSPLPRSTSSSQISGRSSRTARLLEDKKKSRNGTGGTVQPQHKSSSGSRPAGTGEKESPSSRFPTGKKKPTPRGKPADPDGERTRLLIPAATTSTSDRGGSESAKSRSPKYVSKPTDVTSLGHTGSSKSNSPGPSTAKQPGPAGLFSPKTQARRERAASPTPNTTPAAHLPDELATPIFEIHDDLPPDHPGEEGPKVNRQPQQQRENKQTARTANTHLLAGATQRPPENLERRGTIWEDAPAWLKEQGFVMWFIDGHCIKRNDLKDEDGDIRKKLIGENRLREMTQRPGGPQELAAWLREPMTQEEMDEAIEDGIVQVGIVKAFLKRRRLPTGHSQRAKAGETHTDRVLIKWAALGEHVGLLTSREGEHDKSELVMIQDPNKQKAWYRRNKCDHIVSTIVFLFSLGLSALSWYTAITDGACQCSYDYVPGIMCIVILCIFFIIPTTGICCDIRLGKKHGWGLEPFHLGQKQDMPPEKFLPIGHDNNLEGPGIVSTIMATVFGADDQEDGNIWSEQNVRETADSDHDKYS